MLEREATQGDGSLLGSKVGEVMSAGVSQTPELV